MAKRAAFAAPRAIYRDGGYTGVLFFTILAMGLGIGLLAWESTVDYDWDAEGSGLTAAPSVKSIVDADRKAPAPTPDPAAPVVPAPMMPPE